MAEVTKIYSLKTLGFEQIMTELDALAKKFVEVKKAKQDAEKAAADTKRRQKEESDEYKAAKKVVDDLKIAELELAAEKKRLNNELKAAQLLKQQEAAAQKAAIDGNKAEANSIAAIRKERSELNAAIIRVAPGNPVEFRGNTLQYDQAIRKLKQLSAVEQDFRRQFAKDSTLVGEYTSGIIQAFKKLGIDDLVTGQVTKANSKLSELNKEFEVLKQELKSVRESGNGSLENLEKQLIDNRNAAALLEKEVGRLQSELRGTGDIGNQITTGLANGFKAMKGQLAQFVLSYVGFQAAFQGITAGIDTARELSDATTNLEIELGKTAGGADKLVASLQKLNTRTKLTELEAIANIAAKAGVSEENLLGVTQALDKIKIAFGSDFGNVEEGTESLVKLINVFEGTGSVTGENLLRTGNAVRTLANETVASVPFLNDFAKRMAGLKGISDISLPAVLGLASGFEQFGQSSEVAGTALTKVIPKLATDTEKYAKIAGMTRQAFSDLLKNNPAEALIKVSEALVKSKGGIEEISSAFADSQLGSGRIAAILGTVGAKADDFRKAIASAGAAYQSTGNIEDAFAKKNENLASVMDKISKAFADASNSEAFKATLEGISRVVLTIIQLITAIPFSIILGGLGLITAAWAFYKGNLVAATLAQSANNQATLLGSIRLGIMRSGLVGTAAAERAAAIVSQTAAAQKIAALEAQVVAERELLVALQARVVAEGEEALLLRADIASRNAKVVGLEAEILATREATIATEGLNVATKASPLGIILTLVAIAIPALTAFGRSNEEAASKVEGLNSKLKIQGNIEESMREQTTKTKNAVGELITIIKTEVNNQNLRQQAYRELIRIAPEFQGTLDAEYNATDRLNKVYDTYIAKLDQVARAQAIRNIKQKIEDDRATALNREFTAKLAADEEAQQNKAIQAANKAAALQGLTSNNLGGSGAAFGQIKQLQTQKQKEYAEAKEAVKKTNKAATDFDEFMKKASEDDRKALIAGLGGNDKPITTAEGKDLSTLGLAELQEMLKAVNGQIAEIDKIRGKTEAQIAQLKNLRKQRNELRAQIKELGGSLTIPRITASTLTAQDKDQITIEDTRRDLLLAKENTARAQNLESEETYLRNVLKINQESIDRKLALISGESIAEQKIRAELSLKRITDEQDTNKKIFDLRQIQLRNQLDAEIAAIKEQDALTQNDPSKTATERAESKQSADNQILALYVKYNKDVDSLEKALVQQTTRNSREIVKAQQASSQDVIADRKNVALARIKDIETEGEAEVTYQNNKYEKLRNSILSNENLTVTQREIFLERLAKSQKITVLTAELNTLEKELAEKKEMLFQNQISEDEYNKANLAATKKEGELKEALLELQQKRVEAILNRNAQTFEDLTSRAAQRGTIKLFNIDEEDEEAAVEAVGQAVSQAFDLGTQAMHAYYDAEQQRIKDSLALNLERLDQEKEQVKAKATSQAESEAIDKEFAAKKKAAEKAAGEEIKKSRKSELRIALVTEIANIAVAAARFGLPFGPIIFAAMSALALGRYALGVGQINAQQFAMGGEVPKRGGKFKGRPHSQGGTPFGFRGEQYEAEVDELAIIRTRNAPARNKIFQIAGTHQQIASQLNVLGGGIAFEPGAKLKRFETGGTLGATLQAPVFVPSQGNSIVNNRNGLTEEQLNRIISKVDEGISATNGRIDRLQVHVNARDVVKKNNDYTKAANVGTL